MPIFSYDDDAERRRRRLAMTPGINPDAPTPTGLPEISMPRRLPLRTPPIAPARMPGPSESPLPEVPTPNVSMPVPTGIPGGTMGPPLRRPTRGEQYAEARDVYLQGAPGRGRSALTGALEALGRGEGLIGAAAGGLTGAISPRRLREQQFEQRIRPQMMERFAFEDQARAQQAAEAKAQQESALNQARIGELNRRGLPQPPRPVAPLRGRPGDVFLDPETRQPIAQIPQQPRALTSAEEDARIEAELNAAEGTVEEVSQGSFRGRQEMLKKHLTPDERRIIEGGATTGDDPTSISRAWSRWQKIQDDELSSIRRVTGETRKSDVSRKKYGRKGTPGRRAISVKEAADLLK